MSKSSILILLLSIMASSIALALPNDSEQPISIKAERSSLDNAQGFLTYDGQVAFVQGSITILSDHLEVHLLDGRIVYVQATGNPAEFRQMTQADGTMLVASGNLLRYDVASQNLHIDTSAVIIEGENRMSGGIIDYNLANGFAEIIGDPNVGDGRMELIFVPAAKDKK